tara:strand:- start:154 stop:1194 length:1041 start_codon:yes stop_codon:yes gene_type:complete
MATFTYESIKYRFKNPTVDGNLELLDDGASLKIAADDDLVLTHSGSVGDITCSTGALDINASTVNIKDEASSETMASFVSDGAVTLNHDNTARLATSSAGVSITGTTTSSGTITSSANLVIADGGTIGSASDADAITIAAGGGVTFSQTPVFPDGSLPLTDLDIDGGTDIGAALVDADLMIVDDGAGGTNRKAAMSRMKTYILESVYPVGSIFISISATDPGTSLGFGTWSRFGEGRMLVSQNSSDSDFDTAEETGGAKTHTISESQLPSHQHFTMNTGNGFGNSLEDNVNNTGTTNSRGGLGNNDYIMQSVSSAANAGKTSAVGSGSAVTHMNPYIVAYMWKRTS